MRQSLSQKLFHLLYVTPGLRRDSRLPTRNRYIARLIASCILIGSYSPANAENGTCEFKTNTSPISIFFVGRNGDFYRDGSVVADIEIRGTEIETFGNLLGKNLRKIVNGREMRYEIRNDSFDKENYVFYSFLDVDAEGTAVLETVGGTSLLMKEIPSTSVLSMRYRVSSGETDKHRIEYKQRQSLEQILNDAFCLLEYLENE